MGIFDLIQQLGWNAPKARGTIANRYRAALMYARFGEKMKSGEDPRNYSHKVWQRNRRLVPNSDIVAFHRAIENYYEAISNSEEFKALDTGNADAELIITALTWYETMRGC